MKKPRALIIGAGVGGLATAIGLAKHGYEVEIFEKNLTAGGRCQQFTCDGHVFDSGPTMYLFPQVYKKFFSFIEENIDDYFKLIRTDPTYQLNFADKTNFVLTSDLKKMKSQLEKIEPGSYDNFLKYLRVAKEHLSIGLHQLTFKDFVSPFQYFNLRNLIMMLKAKAVTNHFSYVSRFFKHPNLRAAFTFQDSYLSLNPFKSPAIFSMFTYSELINGNYLPEGGMYKVIEALVKVANKYKVKINYNKAVEKIITEGKMARGVILDDKTKVEAKLIVVNADLTKAYEKFFPNDPITLKLSNKKYSCSAVSFHWGVDKIYPQLKTHNLFFSGDYRAGFDEVVDGWKPPKTPHFYIQTPNRTDLTRAPKGEDSVSVIVPINHIDPNNPVDWEDYKNNVRSYILKRLEEIGLEDFQEHIKFEISNTPEDWQEKHTLPYGAIYGLHHNLGQLGYLREKRQHAKYKNIYFAGASTHPGSGLPTVLMSAMFTCQRILKRKFR